MHIKADSVLEVTNIYLPTFTFQYIYIFLTKGNVNIFLKESLSAR